MSDRQPQRHSGPVEREQSRIRDRFGLVLLLLITTVFFSISAPNEPWAWLAITAVLAGSLMVALVASGAQRKVVRAGLVIAMTDLGASITIVLTQVGGDARRYLPIANLLLTLLAVMVWRFRAYVDTISGGMGRTTEYCGPTWPGLQSVEVL